ncbi:MAG: FAD:protein FMN transferase [Sulfuricurvum sp.]
MNPLIRSRPLLGTFVEIWGVSDDRAGLIWAMNEAFDRIGHVQRLASYHDRDSELSAINRLRPGERVKIDPLTYDLLQGVDRLYRESGGLFDPTSAGRLLRHGFHSGVGELNVEVPYGTWEAIELCGELTVRVHEPLRIDLSGIAKGYAVDCAFDVMARRGIETFCVNAGGDLRLRSPGALPVALRHPLFPTLTAETIELSEGAVATSAGYFNTIIDEAGEKRIPLYNPLTHRTGIALRSATVIASECMIADALTKVVHADPDRAETIVRNLGARYVLLSGEGNDVQTRCSGGIRIAM